jgi:hypothetical protein
MPAAKKPEDPALKELQELRKFKQEAEKKALEDQGITEKWQDYKPKKGEEDTVHMLLREPSMRGGQDMSKPFCAKFGRVAYLRNILPNFNGLGYKLIKVLHKPDDLPTPAEYAEQQKKKAAEKAAR